MGRCLFLVKSGRGRRCLAVRVGRHAVSVKEGGRKARSISRHGQAFYNLGACVSALLFGSSQGLGESVFVSTISRSTWDEVLYSEAYNSWRRSLTWLLLCVAMQLVFLRSLDGPHELCKRVIVFIMSHSLGLALQSGRLKQDVEKGYQQAMIGFSPLEHQTPIEVPPPVPGSGDESLNTFFDFSGFRGNAGGVQRHGCQRS